MLRALRTFNRHCEAGQHDHGRRYDVRPLTEPPHYVIEVVPAITFSFTGLTIDDQARVLDSGRTPIPGLLAAGADTGGVFVGSYAGGIASALTFGLHGPPRRPVAPRRFLDRIASPCGVTSPSALLNAPDVEASTTAACGASDRGTADLTLIGTKR